MGPSLAIEVHGSEANRSQSHPIGRPLSTEELHDDVEVAIEGKVCHDEDSVWILRQKATAELKPGSNAYQTKLTNNEKLQCHSR